MKTISVRDLEYCIPNVGRILSQVHFEAFADEFIGILGKNGEGKSTLLDLLLGLITPQEGLIEVLGEDPFSDTRKNKALVSYISQDIEIKGGLSVKEALEFHRLFYPNYDLQLEKTLCSLLKVQRNSKISSLSTGFQRRVQIISALATKPKILFIDEVTAVLDPDARQLLFNILKDYQTNNKATIIMATNVVEDLQGYAHRILYLKDSQLTEHSPSDIYKIFSEKQAG